MAVPCRIKVLMVTLLTESVPAVSQLWTIQDNSEISRLDWPVFVCSSAGFVSLSVLLILDHLASLLSLVLQNVMRDGLVGRPLCLDTLQNAGG
jgi:hypothetical protein